VHHHHHLFPLSGSHPSALLGFITRRPSFLKLRNWTSWSLALFSRTWWIVADLWGFEISSVLRRHGSAPVPKLACNPNSHQSGVVVSFIIHAFLLSCLWCGNISTQFELLVVTKEPKSKEFLSWCKLLYCDRGSGLHHRPALASLGGDDVAAPTTGQFLRKQSVWLGGLHILMWITSWGSRSTGMS
jgi:hypothetical protein